MLIDSFLYFNESELVELRIKYLNNIVDYFVVVEANITHQGKKKDQLLIMGEKKAEKQTQIYQQNYLFSSS